MTESSLVTRIEDLMIQKTGEEIKLLQAVAACSGSMFWWLLAGHLHVVTTEHWSLVPVTESHRTFYQPASIHQALGAQLFIPTFVESRISSVLRSQEMDNVSMPLVCVTAGRAGAGGEQELMTGWDQGSPIRHTDPPPAPCTVPTLAPCAAHTRW